MINNQVNNLLMIQKHNFNHFCKIKITLNKKLINNNKIINKMIIHNKMIINNNNYWL